MSKKLIIVINKKLDGREIERFGLKSLSNLGWKILVINFRKTNNNYFAINKKISIVSIYNFKQFLKSLD